MKNTQKKKITRNYHLLTKVESGKCRRVTAAIDVICLNSGGIQTNAKIGKHFFPGQKTFSGTMLRYFSQMMVTQKEKLNRQPPQPPTASTATPFWPQGSLSYGELWGHDWIPSRWPPEGHCRLVFPRSCDLTWQMTSMAAVTRRHLPLPVHFHRLFRFVSEIRFQYVTTVTTGSKVNSKLYLVLIKYTDFQ